jgi:hypothetical protein
MLSAAQVSRRSRSGSYWRSCKNHARSADRQVSQSLCQCNAKRKVNMKGYWSMLGVMVASMVQLEKSQMAGRTSGPAYVGVAVTFAFRLVHALLVEGFEVLRELVLHLENDLRRRELLSTRPKIRTSMCSASSGLSSLIARLHNISRTDISTGATHACAVRITCLISTRMSAFRGASRNRAPRPLMDFEANSCSLAFVR